MEALKKGALYVMSEQCVDNYFEEHNYLDVQCFRAVLSKTLGIVLILGSLMVKMPQVLKIFNSKSGEGINLVSVLFDLTAITFHMSYSYVSGFPFSAWGDNTFLALQTAAIAALVLVFKGSKVKSFIFCIIYASIVYTLCSGLTPHHVLKTVQKLNIPILLVGKLSQAVTNYKNSSTGQLSAVTAFLMFGGSLARIFTSIQETGDKMMIITFCASSFANGVICSQILYYWKKGNKEEADAKKATSASKASAAKKLKSKKVE